uniref:Uncharacterized protein n=1 Tax=Strongyloides papillosus TaxID=174720 RepID=A0A0N5BE40_STREA
MAKKFMLLFGLFLIIFSLNVIQSKLYESKPSDLSEASSNVQKYLVSLDNLSNSNIQNNIVKREVSGADKQEYLVGRSMISQSGQRRHLSHVSSGAKMLRQPRGPGKAGKIGGRVQPGRKLQRGRRLQRGGRRQSGRRVQLSRGVPPGKRVQSGRRVQSGKRLQSSRKGSGRPFKKGNHPPSIPSGRGVKKSSRGRGRVRQNQPSAGNQPLEEERAVGDSSEEIQVSEDEDYSSVSAEDDDVEIEDDCGDDDIDDDSLDDGFYYNFLYEDCYT